MFKTSQTLTYRNDKQQQRRPPDVYLYTSVPHFDKQRGATGVVHIGVGFLRCSFSVVGIAKALNMERTKGRFPRFFIYSFHLTFIRLPGGSQGDTHRKIGHDSCGTAYRTYASRTGTHSYLVRRTVMLYTSQYIQDIQEGKYRHPSSLAHFVHTRS